MVSFLTVFIVFVIGIILICLKKEDWVTFIGIIDSVISGIIFVIMLSILTTIESDFDYTKETYYNLKNQIEYVSHDDIVTSENLRNQVLEMNNIISKHKIYSKNKWTNLWYSSEIGNLTPLKWNDISNINNE